MNEFPETNMFQIMKRIGLFILLFVGMAAFGAIAVFLLGIG
jgi:hypothetical protein